MIRDALVYWVLRGQSCFSIGKAYIWSLGQSGALRFDVALLYMHHTSRAHPIIERRRLVSCFPAPCSEFYVQGPHAGMSRQGVVLFALLEPGFRTDMRQQTKWLS